MDFNLHGVGTVHTAPELECDFEISWNEFASRFAEYMGSLPEPLRDVLRSAISTRRPQPVDEMAHMQLDPLFMQIGASLMQASMAEMRTCGAAKFLPPTDFNIPGVGHARTAQQLICDFDISWEDFQARFISQIEDLSAELIPLLQAAIEGTPQDLNTSQNFDFHVFFKDIVKE